MSTAPILEPRRVEWLTAAEAAARVKAKSVAAFYAWLKAHPEMPVGRYGADIRIDAFLLDQFIAGLLTARGERLARRGRRPSPKSLRVVRGQR